MLKIGVNEPVIVEKAEKNEKGTLVITMKEADDTKVAKPKASLLDSINEASDTSGNMDLSATSFMFFPPSTSYQDAEIEPAKKVQNLMKFKNQMQHILQQFTIAKNIKWNVLAGLPPMKTEEQLLEQIQEEANYLKVYTNIVDQFLAQANTLKIFASPKKFRLFLVRQSAEKHYGRMRDNFLDSRPFLEDITIPKDKSKMYVKAGTKGATAFFEPDADGYIPNFDAYEIKGGKDNPIQSASTGDAPTNTPEEASAVEGVFGQKTEEPINFGAPEEDGGMNFGTPAEEE